MNQNKPSDHQGEHLPIPSETEKAAKAVLDAAFTVHSNLGPGLLESVYETCLAHELRIQGLAVQVQITLPVVYADIRIDTGYRLDMLIDNRVIVEIKSVEQILPVHQAQILTYLKLSGYRLAFLINFNVRHLRDGIQRFVN
jgi:GxxExxY protein